MRKTLIVSTVCLLSLSACANGTQGLRPLTYQEPAETRLLVSYANCPNTPPEKAVRLGPVLAAVAIAAASQLLDNFGTALQQGAAGGDLPSSVASTNIELDPDQTPSCIIVIRGHFQPQKAGDQPHDWSKIPKYVPGTKPDTNHYHLLLKSADHVLRPFDLPAVYDLQHFIELQLQPSSNSSAMTFVPVMTLIRQSMDGDFSGKRGLSIALKFETPGANSTGGAILLADNDVGIPRQETRLETGEFTHQAPWFGGIQVKESASSKDAKQQPAGDPQLANLPAQGSSGPAVAQDPPPRAGGGVRSKKVAAAKGKPKQAAKPHVPSLPAADTGPKGPIPYTVTATVVESRPTKEFLAFVASVFTASKPAIETAIKGKLDAEAATSASNSALDAQASYATQIAAANTAILDYCALGDGSKPSDRWTKSAAAESAQLKANEAAQTAHVDRPFHDLVVVSGDPVDVANHTVCSGGGA